MGVLGIILLIAFIIVCLLLVAIVLLQNEEGDGLGGLLGGASNVAFGSRAGNVLTRTTYVLVTLFFCFEYWTCFIEQSSIS
jgi:preprotein translocase subunit SecG